ncbi:MAG TPA: DUF2784 domain-containing protein [Candidatus Sulfotelmatobacter sp.]|nr:DUF2784 domain-containing protein [Candidatus Sulfotelmatobacter sp.]
MAANIYIALSVAVLLLHILFILWVIFGALVTRNRPVLRALHVASLIWGILTELTAWPCPLTLLENWLEARAGVEPYQGGFLLHYLDRLVYPDISITVLVTVGMLVCMVNLALYGWQVWSSVHSRPAK